MSIYEIVGFDVVEQKENIQIDLRLQSIDRFEKKSKTKLKCGISSM